MEVNNEESRLSVQFGHDWAGEAPTHFRLNLVVSQQEVKNEVEKLNQLVPGDVSAGNAIVLVFSCQSYNQDALVEAINEAFNQILPLSPIPLGPDAIGLKISKGFDKLVVTISPAGAYQEKVAEIKEMIEGLGLLAIAQDQMNKIQINCEVNRTFSEIASSVQNGESFLCALLYQAKFFIKLFLDKNFGETLKNQLCTLVDPSLEGIPPLVALQYLRRINLDLKFNSTQDLPNLFKKFMCNPSVIRNMEPEKKKVTSLPPLFEKFLTNLESPVEVHVNVAEFAGLNLSISGPQFVSFFKDFGGAALSCFSQTGQCAMPFK